MGLRGQQSRLSRKPHNFPPMKEALHPAVTVIPMGTFSQVKSSLPRQRTNLTLLSLETTTVLP